MSTPTPIAFEVSGKPAAAPRNTTAASGDRSFADAVQAQRDAGRRNRDDAANDAAAASRPEAKRAEPQQTSEERPRRDGAGAVQRDQAKGSAQAQSARADGDPAKTGAKTTSGEATEAERAAKAASQAATKGNSASHNAAASETKATQSAQAQSAGSTASAKSAADAANTVTSNKQGAQVSEHQIKVAGKETSVATARPAHAATAFAAQTAQRGQETGGSTQAATQASAATTEASAGSAPRAGVSDPTAQALKKALSGQRGAKDVTRQDDPADPRTTRPEARSANTRGLSSMSPALRAAAEAVQQQLTGGQTNAGSTWTQNAGQNAGQGAGQSAGPGAPRAEAAGSAPAATAQSFDPVLQNVGPQPAGGGQSGSLSAAGNAASTAGTGAGNPAPTTPPAEQVAVQMQRAAAHGQSRVQIRLNPAELGRIDVKMEVSDDGHVRAVIAVDKPETLDLMQRDPRALERALQGAGLKTDQDSLTFSLRDDGTGKGQNGSGDGDERPGGVPGRTAGAPTGDQPVPGDPLHAGLAAEGRIDIRV